MKIQMSIENFDEKHYSLIFEIESNNDDIRFRILRRDELLSFKNDARRYENETLFFKHKYFKLLLFYNDTTK